MKTQRLLGLLLCLIFLFLFSNPLKSQDKQTELKKGIPVSDLLKAGEKHRFKVSLDANMFAFFSLQQDGVDAMVTTIDPEGKKIQSFDSPNGRKGPEPGTVVFWSGFPIRSFP